MNIPQNVWPMFRGFLGVLIALAAVFLVKEIKSIGYVGANPDQTNTITVDGTGDAYAVPDVATFSYTVMDTETTVSAAQAKATTEANSALAAVRASGVADADIQTTGYSIQPQYQYQNAVCPAYSATDASVSANGTMIPAYCPPGKQTLTGYQVSESVSVKLRDLSKAGSLLTTLGSANVSDLNGPSFDVDDPDSVQAQARSKAIADAQAKADELAKELGVGIVRVTSFSESSGSYPQPIMYAAMSSGAMAKAPAPVTPEISAGQQKVTDNVTITYEIH